MPFIIKIRKIFSYTKKKWKEYRNTGSASAPSRPTESCNTLGVTSTNTRDKRLAGWNTIRSLITVIEPGAKAIGLPIHGLRAFVDRLESAFEEREEYAELAAQLNAILDDLAKHVNQPIGTEMTASVKRIYADLEDEIKKVTERQAMAMRRRLIGAMEEANEIMECYRRIDGYLQRLTLNANISILKAVNEQTAYVQKQAMEARLKNMSPATAAVFDSAESHNVRRRSCAPGTRTAQIKLLLDWAHDPEVGRTCWLNGMAGTGKTTIAYSVCEALKEEYQLAASFFCSRTIPQCRQVKHIIPSIAYQLARFSLPFWLALDKALEADPDTHTLALETQYKKLIVEPLLASQDSLPRSFIVVIDALDECENEGIVGQILDLLLSTKYTLPVRYLMSSRPEKEITRRTENCGNTSDNPPRRCGALFIYASTICRYIRQAHEVDALGEALNLITNSTAIPMKQDNKNVIDDLYTTILLTAFHRSEIDEMRETKMRDILETVICAMEPMTLHTIGQVVGLKNAEQVDRLLKPLRSVLNVGKENKLVTPLHASFPDFMLSKDRSKDLCCERGKRHAQMAKVCLELISKAEPQFNICRLPSSHLLDSEVDDLDTRITNSISQGLSYACRHWPTHLGFAEHQDEFVGSVRHFFSSRLLLWMEIINLTKHIRYGTTMIQNVEKWCSEHKVPEDMTKLVHDASQFVSVYANHPVSRSTPHIYVSMLPFWPPSRPVSVAYMPRTTGIIEPEGTAMARRRLALIATWKVSSRRIRSIGLSGDGTRLAVHNEGSIEVYDTSTGETISSLTNECTRGVHSVAISPDGTQVAFAKYRAAYIWNVGNRGTTANLFPNLTPSIKCIAFSSDGCRACGTRNGEVHIHALHDDITSRGPLKGHTEEVTSIAFSRDSLRLASASGDGTVRVREVRTGQTVGEPFKEHTRSVYSVCYSPDGSRLASASWDHSIQVRGVSSGTMAPELLTIHTPHPRSIAFSPSGAFIASGSADKAIRVYDARTGQIVLGPLDGHTERVTSLIFSPDSARLYSCSRDGTVRIWNVQDLGTHHTLSKAPALSSGVYRIRYSNSGKQLVSDSSDGTLHVWDVKTGELVMEPLRGHQKAVLSVDYSHSDTYIASASSDGTLRIWDALSGSDIHGPIEHSNRVNCVRFSPDDSCIASGSLDGTVKIWDVTSGQQIVELFRAHEFHVATSVELSPDGQQVAFGYGSISDLGDSEDPLYGAIRVVDRSTGDTVAGPINVQDFITSIEFSPNGMRLVSGSYDKSVRIWDVQTGEQLVACGEVEDDTRRDDKDSNNDRGHRKEVNSVAFSPNGHYVASGSDDMTVCIWDAENGNLVLGPLKAHTSRVYFVQFSPDSSHIASCSDDRTVLNDQHLSSNLDRQIGTDSWSVDEEGWVMLRGHRVVWVPSDLRPCLMCPPEDFMIADRGCLILNLDGLNVGDKWQDCYQP
ncbi:WD40 repeat-like protein [Rhizoctonia solani]|uniref:WD40 repeat-like protein n=1 Tax=Rhizoctonia solani TaxID=456999 RepID=A0A8H7ILH2_9AGAM|nr:WD40 repeat-like protein [Rhizoctonia solani]